MIPRVRMLPCLLLGALPLVLAACGTYPNQPQADSATIIPGIGVDITVLDNQAVSGMPASLYVSPGEHTLTFRCQDPNDPDTGGAPVYQQVEVELLAQHAYQFAANGLNVTLWDVTNGPNAGMAVLNWDLNDAIADEDQPSPIEGGVYATLGGNFVRPPLGGDRHDDRDHSGHPGEPPKNGGKPAPSAPSIPHTPRPSGGGGSSHAGSGGGSSGGSHGGGGSSGGGGGGSHGGGGGGSSGGGGGSNKR